MTFLFGDEHVQRYRETDGEEGHVWREDSTILLLTTKGPEHRPRPDRPAHLRPGRCEAEGDERKRLWAQMNRMWPHYDEYQTKTDRRIPVVVLEPE